MRFISALLGITTYTCMFHWHVPLWLIVLAVVDSIIAMMAVRP